MWVGGPDKAGGGGGVTPIKVNIAYSNKEHTPYIYKKYIPVILNEEESTTCLTELLVIATQRLASRTHTPTLTVV